MSDKVEGLGVPPSPSAETAEKHTTSHLAPSQRDEKETAAALVGAGIRLRFEKNYILTLESYFDGWKVENTENLNEKKFRSDKKLLMSSDGRQILELVWKESSHIPEMSLAVSGYEKSILAFDPSITDLADAIVSVTQNSSDSGYREGSRVRQRVQRVIEAAEFFGLLMRPEAKGGCARPVRTCDCLHSLMKQIHHQNISEIARLISPSSQNDDGV